VRGRKQLAQRREQRPCGRRDGRAGARRLQRRDRVLHRLRAGGRAEGQGRHSSAAVAAAQQEGDAVGAPGPRSRRRHHPPQRPASPARASARPPSPPGRSAAGPRAARRRRARHLGRPARATHGAATDARCGVLRSRSVLPAPPPRLSYKKRHVHCRSLLAPWRLLHACMRGPRRGRTRCDRGLQQRMRSPHVCHSSSGCLASDASACALGPRAPCAPAHAASRAAFAGG